MGKYRARYFPVTFGFMAPPQHLFISTANQSFLQAVLVVFSLDICITGHILHMFPVGHHH
jgi:hypothetical protein